MSARVLIIIPAYNEEESIVNAVEDIRSHTTYDYVIINDGSADRTEEVVRQHGFNLISLPVNYGLAGAVQTGFLYALEHDYDVAVQFDGDGQHKAEYIPALIEQIENGYDVVIGSRFVNEKKDFSARMIGSRLLSFIIRLTTGKKINDPTSGFRAYSKTVIPEFAAEMNYPPEPDSISYLLRRGYRISEVQVQMEERKFGKSYLNVWSSARYMSRMVISILLIQQFRKKERS